ncbi:MAG: hypothetical protein AAB556_01525 [Patescibacteria group bacterium]
MIIYFIILALSLGGISVMALRNRKDILEFQFARFCDGMLERLSDWWYGEAHSYFLKVLEKALRRFRIWTLKMESFLFRKVHAVRGISERKENGSDS